MFEFCFCPIPDNVKDVEHCNTCRRIVGMEAMIRSMSAERKRADEAEIILQTTLDAFALKEHKLAQAQAERWVRKPGSLDEDDEGLSWKTAFAEQRQRADGITFDLRRLIDAFFSGLVVESGEVDRAIKELERLRANLVQANVDLTCDVCCGKVPVVQDCICGGTGLTVVARNNLRIELVEARQKLAPTDERVQALLAQCGLLDEVQRRLTGMFM